jgi:hypothetical protein
VGHDERFKLLLREFLREFFELFFPDLVGLLDFAAAVWLQQELITGPRERNGPSTCLSTFPCCRPQATLDRRQC